MQERNQKQLNHDNNKLASKPLAKNIFSIKESIKSQNIKEETNVFKKKYKRKKKIEPIPLEITNIAKPIWLSVSEAAKLGGVQDKTIRRAIQSKTLTYKVVNNRYAIELSSLIKFLYSKTKLRNKLNYYGIGQYINKWKD